MQHVVLEGLVSKRKLSVKKENCHESENWISWDIVYMPEDSFLLLYSHKESQYFKTVCPSHYDMTENRFGFCNNKKVTQTNFSGRVFSSHFLISLRCLNVGTCNIFLFLRAWSKSHWNKWESFHWFQFILDQA